jgi:hypothetical protein
MDETDIKKPRERSKEYPLFTQKFCIEFTETINSKLGNRVCSGDQLSKTFGKPITSLGSRLSSCKQYDLLELKKGDGYKPTDLFFKITRGRTDNDKREAKIQSLKNPTIYSDLLEKYENQELPTDLPSIFYWDYKITENAKDGAAKIFLENLQDLGLLSDDGRLILSNNGEKPTDPIEPTVDPTKPPAAVKPPPVVGHAGTVLPPASGFKRSDIKVSPGRFVTLEFPADLSTAEIDKLIQNLELWKD